MTSAEYITSRKNPLMTQIRRLATSRSYRREQGLFLVDGAKLLDEALAWNAIIEVVVAAEGVPLPALPEGARLVRVPDELMAYISTMEQPQGILFLCKLQTQLQPEQLTGGRYLILDGLQDPGNVGTIWRTADALWADGLILVNGCADAWNPKTVRATMGACFRLPVYEMTIDGLAGLLSGAQLPLYAAALRADAVELAQAQLGRCAVAIGSEGSGVSPELLALSERTVLIPMRERCESLNAATAAAVVLWEMVRQQG